MRLLLPAPGCDCRRCPFFMGDAGAGVAPGPEPICSGSSASCSYCGCAASASPATPAPCRGCPIRCGSRHDIAEWMADVGGTLSFDDVPALGDVPTGMPRFVPQLDANTVEALDVGLAWGAYAIGMRRWLSPTTHDLYPRYQNYSCAREALGLDPAGPQLAVLVGYGEDPLVEAFWTRRFELGLIERLAAQRWDLVLTPNFSMYANQPRTEHLLNFRRNLLLAAELVGAGVPAVPNIYWARKEDLDRYLAWVEDVSPPALAVNLQTFRTEDDWEGTALPGLTYLSVCLAAQTKLVFTGGTRPNRLADLCRLFGDRWWYVSQKPVQAARHGRQLTAEGEAAVYARPEDLFANNVRFASELVEHGFLLGAGAPVGTSREDLTP